jgi:putative transposase
VSDPSEHWAPDLVDREFTVRRPNRLWVADLTYVATWAGFLYVAVVIDAFSRRVIGWPMEPHLRTELVLAALEMAYSQRAPCPKVIFHSDHGTQYTSIAFGQRCEELEVRPSMGSVGDAYDNAMAESFFASLECEVLDRNRFRTREEARMAVFSWIEGWYNPRRRHSSLGYLSPEQFEYEVTAKLEPGGAELLTPARQTDLRVRRINKPKSKTVSPRRRTSTNHIVH